MSLLKLILSYFFGLAVYARNWMYDVGILKQFKLDDFVISVGNIAVGGTGKSPFVVELIRFIQNLEHRFHIVVLTRGYKSGLGRGDWLCLRDGKVAFSSSERAKNCKPDEALMQSLMCPQVDIMVGSRRLENAKVWQSTIRQDPTGKTKTIWILDDGFQHRKIYRDLEILLLDAERPFGELLPRGLFREPAEALCRADELVFTRARAGMPRPGDLALVELHGRDSKVSRAVFETRVPKPAFDSVNMKLSEGQEVCVVSGLASNSQFLRAIKDQGFLVNKVVEFDDHAQIDSSRIQAILGSNLNIPIVTTSKDYSRSRDVFSSLPYTVYIAELSIQVPADVLLRLKDTLSQRFSL